MESLPTGQKAHGDECRNTCPRNSIARSENEPSRFGFGRGVFAKQKTAGSRNNPSPWMGEGREGVFGVFWSKKNWVGAGFPILQSEPICPHISPWRATLFAQSGDKSEAIRSQFIVQFCPTEAILARGEPI